MVRYVHANALTLNGQGVLIRGASKSGKSSLTLALIGAAERAGQSASLVGDDRIGLRVSDGALMASGHPRIAGMIEVRGAGIAHLSFTGEARIVLVVDLVETESSEGYDGFTTIENIDLRHLRLPARDTTEKMLQRITRVLK